MRPNESIKLNRQSEAYNLIFISENILRVSMHNCLVKKKGVNYFNKDNLPKFEYNFDGNQQEIDMTKIVTKAISTKNEEKKYKKIIGYEYPFLWYLDLAVLIMLLDNFWDIYFLDIFKNPKNIRNEIIDRGIKISSIRNAIAHNRYITDIDSGDLKSFHKILSTSIRDEFLNNFDELVFNKLEELLISFNEYNLALIDIINSGDLIPRELLRNWEYLFGALQTQINFSKKIKHFEEIKDLLVRYNKDLPRKPGRIDEIRSFVVDNELIQKIKYLAQ